MKNKHRFVTQEILMDLVKAGGIITALAVSPALILVPIAYTLYEDITKKEAQNSYYQLKRKGWISSRTHNGKTSVSITQKGRRHIAKISLLNVQPLYSKKWDNQWRIVSYDIPVRDSEKRNALRSFLKRLGFFQMHRSVWISPYDCTKELDTLMSFFNINQDNVRLIISQNIGDAGRFKKHFKV